MKPHRDEDREREAPTLAETSAETMGGVPGAAERSIPQSLPGYRVVRVIGEGGMGVVLEAEQQSPQRRVAIKLMRGGALAGSAALELFQREIQTLARLRHPNIAQIYESGHSDDGAPFLAMEFAGGVTLDEYLRGRRKLDAEEIGFRLRLFRTICLAIHHAHQRGVIHRDLKPANVLVNPDTLDAEGLPLVKVLDFGIARLLDEEPGSDRTAMGIVRGTLAYMSPEQAQGLTDEIDTRTDVYALGVVLFEMLAGSRPHDFGTGSALTAVKQIAEAEPRRLEQAWPEGAARLDPDISTIVRKALEKERDRRYASCEALARDVDRFLRNEPILARPPSTAYQLRKFAARNRALVAGVVATTLVLLGGIVVSTWLGLEEARQRRGAEKLAGFQAGMLQQIDIADTGDRLEAAIRRQLEQAESTDLTTSPRELTAQLEALARELNWTDVARDVVDQNILRPASESVGREFRDQPEIEAQLRGNIGLVYRTIGLYDRAFEEFQRATALSVSAFGADSPDTMEFQFQIAQVEWLRGELAPAVKRLEELKTRQAALLGESHVNTLKTRRLLASVALMQEDLEHALAAATNLLPDQEKALGRTHEETLETINLIGAIHLKRADFEPAEAVFETLAARANEAGIGQTNRYARQNIATVRMRQNDNEGAMEILELLVDELSESVGEEHPDTLSAMNNLGMVYSRLQRYEDAYEIGRRTVEISRRVLGSTNADTRRATNNLAVRLQDLGRYDQAAELLDELLALDRQAEPDSAAYALHLHTYAELEMARERWRAARDKLTEAIAIYRRTNHRYLSSAEKQLAEIEQQLR